MREDLRRQIEQLLSIEDIDFIRCDENGISLEENSDHRTADLFSFKLSCLLPVTSSFSARENFIFVEEM